MKIKIAFIFLISALIIVFTYCQSSTEPGETFKDPRGMTWTVDTLTYPGAFQVLMRSVWGSSPSDVYVAGHNSSPDGKLWHYDGISWKEIMLRKELGLMNHGPSKVFGFSKNDVWVVGNLSDWEPNHEYVTNTPLLVHYNGTKWEKYNLSQYNRNQSRPLWGIGGDRPDNVWVGGTDGLVAQFDGMKWTQDTVRIENLDQQFINIADITVYNHETYLIAQYSNPYSKEWNRYFSIKGTLKHWTIVDSIKANEVERFGHTNLYSNFGKLYSLVPNVYELVNGSWTTKVYFGAISDLYVAFNMSGPSENNFIIAGGFGLFHWNGVDKKEIPLPGYRQYSDVIWNVWYDGHEAFVVGYSQSDQNMSYIWHGK